jgi:hypothetical protein
MSVSGSAYERRVSRTASAEALDERRLDRNAVWHERHRMLVLRSERFEAADIYINNGVCAFFASRDPQIQAEAGLPPDVLRCSGLIIPVVHRCSPFDLTPEEWAATQDLLIKARLALHQSSRPTVTPWAGTTKGGFTHTPTRTAAARDWRVDPQPSAVRSSSLYLIMGSLSDGLSAATPLIAINSGDQPLELLCASGVPGRPGRCQPSRRHAPIRRHRGKPD